MPTVAVPMFFAKVLCLFFCLQAASCSKILCLMNIPSHSHHFWNLVYLKALAARGHEVTYLGYDDYPNPDKGIRYFQIEGGYDVLGEIDFTEVADHGAFQTFVDLLEWEDFIAKSDQKQKGFKKFIEMTKKETFDLVVYDLATATYILGAVDAVGRPPVIGITAFGTPSWSLDFSGTPYPIANNPHFLLPFANKMSFLERLENAVFYLFVWINMELYTSRQNEIMKSAFGPNVRHLKEIQNDVTINLVNSNWGPEAAYPTAPGLIHIGGLHLKPPKALPKDLQDYLDKAVDGVIYFSLGSNIKSTMMDKRVIQMFIDAFKEISPVKVLWKWENDELPGRPSNVKISKWLPQNDILAHPNVRLFFTHGGMLSTQEATQHGVPVVGLPFFLDQHVNIQRAVRGGFGESIALNTISKESVLTAIQKVLSNPSYKNKMMRMSELVRDRQVAPLDEAIYWTEYAIRHQGAPHLKPHTMDLNWFQSHLIDVYAVFVAAIVLVFLVLRFVLRSISSLFGSKKSKIKKK